MTVMAALLGLLALLLGSFPTGLVIARARGIDLRKVGSGNIGATNASRALGRRWGLVVLLADAAKGLLPVLAARAANLPSTAVAAIGLCAVVGHMFSVFLKGRGGKGVATSLGAALGIAPLAALACLAVYVALYAAFRISSVGSLGAVVAFPAALWLIGPAAPAYLAFAGAIAVLVVLRHEDNIRRLLRGEELRG